MVGPMPLARRAFILGREFRSGYVAITYIANTLHALASRWLFTSSSPLCREAMACRTLTAWV